MGAAKETDNIVLPSPNCKKIISYEELKKHDKPTDRWLLIENKVYDITNWAKRHPGGGKILGHFSGEDATVGKTALYVKMVKAAKIVLFVNW